MRAQAVATLMAPQEIPRIDLAVQTRELLAGVEHEVDQIEALDELVRALVDRGVWGRVGRFTWARDAADGLLLLWEPAR